MFNGKPLRAVGAMSGTSLDGIDAAEVITDGETITGFGETAYRPYTSDQQTLLRDALGRWPGDDLDAVAEMVETTHAQVLAGFDTPDVIGFHGQTLAHDPHGRGTHQCGDGAILAEVLGAPVVWDFRSSDVQLGGQGAPLAPFFHFALAKYIGADAPLVFLNLGGVGNLSWVDPSKSKPEEAGALLAFDTGPANAPINDFMQGRLGRGHDAGGALAKQGQVQEAALADFLNHGYFLKMPPKSLDRNSFAGLLEAVKDLSNADAAATLTAAAAMSVAMGLAHCPAPPRQILVSGGGRHNATLMEMLAAGVDCPVRPVEDVGLNGDMIEAQAFAYLAVRVARGLPTSCHTTTGVRAAVSGGIVSRPQSVSA